MSPRVNDTSTSANQGLFSPQAKAAILQELDHRIATFPADVRHTIQAGGWLAHECLVIRGIQYANMLDPQENLHSKC